MKNFPSEESARLYLGDKYWKGKSVRFNCGSKGLGLKNIVHDISSEQDQEIALVKLLTMGYEFDKLTKDQIKYLNDYFAGTESIFGSIMFIQDTKHVLCFFNYVLSYPIVLIFFVIINKYVSNMYKIK